MDAKVVLSRSAIGLRIVLGIISILSTLVIGLTCLFFMFIALMFCDSCSGIGDWVKDAGLPLGGMGAAVLASTVAGFALGARRRWVIGSICLAVAPGLILANAVSPTLRQASPVLAIAGMPVQMYHDQQHTREVQKAAVSLMTQARTAIAGSDGPIGEGWRRTGTGQVAIDGLSLELCNAAANSASRQQPALSAQCKHTSGTDFSTGYTFAVEVRTSHKPN